MQAGITPDLWACLGQGKTSHALNHQLTTVMT